VAQGLLAEIMDGDNVRNTINQMTRGEVYFYNQFATAINNDVKSKFRMGVESDFFLPYLRKYMRKQVQTEGVEYGLQQATGNDMLLSLQNIQNDMPTRAYLNGLLGRLGGGGGGGGGGGAGGRMRGRGFRNAVAGIDRLRRVVPDPEEIAHLRGCDDDSLWSEVSSAVSELPSVSDIESVMSDIDASASRGDAVSAERHAGNLADLVVVRDDILNMLNNAKSQLARIRGQPQESYDNLVASSQEASSLVNPSPPAYAPSTPPQSPFSFFISPDSQVEEQEADYLDEVYPHFPSGGASSKSTPATEPYQAGTPLLSRSNSQSSQSNANLDLTLPPIQEVLNFRSSQLLNLYEAFQHLAQQLGGEAEKEFDRLVRNVDRNNIRSLRTLFSTPDLRAGFARILGLRKKQYGRGLRMKGRGVKPTKVPAIERYGRIGNHIIKLAPLEKNILTINTPNGWAVKGFPSRTISSNLVKVIKEMVGEGLPKYSSIEDLTEDEKDFLNKVARITKIEDRVNVKTPSKTDLDKLVNRFEILKGEIVAGNNNNELVKEFKKIIITLSNEGMLPKGQAREILMDLVALGF
jgi:hypothetical protein